MKFAHNNRIESGLRLNRALAVDFWCFLAQRAAPFFARVRALAALIITPLIVSCAGVLHDPAEGGLYGEYRSKATLVESLPGSAEPNNILEPHMPSVDVLSDMDALFAEARKKGEVRNIDGRIRAGARQVVLISPGRQFLLLPGLDPNRLAQLPADPVQVAKSIFGTDQPLTITVVSYTALEAMVEEHRFSLPAINRSIPFAGMLIAHAYAGHSVVIFEGHQSAFVAGVRNSDVLIVDSAMLPFLQEDWLQVAVRSMHAGAKAFVFDRSTYALQRALGPLW